MPARAPRSESRIAAPSRRRAPEEKRRRLLAVAARLVGERGAEGLRTADVAREAGVSEGILFHHFGSKRGLLAALAGQVGDEAAEAMFPPGGEGEPDVEAARSRLFAYVRRRTHVVRSLAWLPEGPDREAARQAERRAVVSALARVFRAEAARGRMRPMDPEVVAELLFALVGAALTRCFVVGDGHREADYLRETIHCVEAALAPSRARGPVRCHASDAAPAAIHERTTP